ncbi:MAG: N-acetylmuramoyl-L-alanine amidase family protein, partial [Gemmatimonadales bacterium]
DPGHPPGGGTGPTGLREPEATLAVAELLEPMLTGAGARVVMTRRGAGAVSLIDRIRLADSLDADLMLSIHGNALPDGVPPDGNHGSSVFYFHPRSADLARQVQARLVEELGTRDLGIARGDLAVVRPTWMPAVLAEGLFMMWPEHEAWLRAPEGRRRYARALMAGLEDYFRGFGTD